MQIPSLRCGMTNGKVCRIYLKELPDYFTMSVSGTVCVTPAAVAETVRL